MAAAPVPDQSNIQIPITAIPIDLAVKMAPAAVDGIIWLKDEGRYVSSAVFFDGLIQQKIPAVIDPARVATGLGVTTGAGIAATAALCLTPLGPFALLGWLIAEVAVPIHSTPRACTIIIINLLKGDLTLKKTYLVNGLQTGHPAISDGSTKFAADKDKDIIPGLLFTDTACLASIGVYQFQKNLQATTGFVGTAGAISFTCSDPKAKGKELAIAWNVPEGADATKITTPGLGITPDLLGNYQDIGAFYSATADTPTSNVYRRDHSGPVRMDACYGPRKYDDTTLHQIMPAEFSDLALTVLIQ